MTVTKAKYSFSNQSKINPMNDKRVYRIVAKRAIPLHGVKKGDLGGFMESGLNLSQEGDCWIGEDAVVFGGASVTGNALVKGKTQVFDGALVTGSVQVDGNYTWIYGDAKVDVGTITNGYVRDDLSRRRLVG
jgi:hypothetical protein